VPAKSRRTLKPSIGDDGIPIKVVLDPGEHTSTYYANHFEVARGRHELTVIAGRLVGKISRERMREATDSRELLVDPEFQMLVAPSLVPGLIKALQTQLDMWTKEHGTSNAKEAPNERRGRSLQ
jgi:hypothetical protein